MTQKIEPQFTTVSGLSVRYATGGAAKATALVLSPWPESIYAYEPTWNDLTQHATVTAVDLPGYGQSERRDSLMSPMAMGDFIIELVDHFKMAKPHLVGPDIGSPAGLFAAAQAPDRFRSLVVGSGGVAVPVNVNGPLKQWSESTDLEPYRRAGGEIVVETIIKGMKHTPSRQAQDDYIASYAGSRFAETLPFVQKYAADLPILEQRLSRITAPVRIVQGSDDAVVPAANSEYLHERLPNSRVDFIDGVGHFCWEDGAAEYAALVIDWWEQTST